MYGSEDIIHYHIINELKSLECTTTTSMQNLVKYGVIVSYDIPDENFEEDTGSLSVRSFSRGHKEHNTPHEVPNKVIFNMKKSYKEDQKGVSSVNKRSVRKNRSKKTKRKSDLQELY